MTEKDTQRITTFYEEALQEFGEHDARSLHWVDAFHQVLRFQVLLQIGTIDEKRILDVGCGLGDFYKFLIKKKIEVKYTGIDIIPDFIKIAQKKYPEAHFKHQDIFTLDPTETYDYIFGSGAMSFKVERNNDFYFRMIEKMYDQATSGVAFNMLNNADHIDNETFAAYSPKDIADFCYTFCPHVEVITDYMPQDFTVFLHK